MEDTNEKYPETSWSKERYAICKQCDRLNKVLKVCKECNCFMPLKTKFQFAWCPIGKWGEDPNTWENVDEQQG